MDVPLNHQAEIEEKLKELETFLRVLIESTPKFKITKNDLTEIQNCANDFDYLQSNTYATSLGPHTLGILGGIVTVGSAVATGSTSRWRIMLLGGTVATVTGGAASICTRYFNSRFQSQVKETLETVFDRINKAILMFAGILLWRAISFAKSSIIGIGDVGDRNQLFQHLLNACYDLKPEDIKTYTNGFRAFVYVINNLEGNSGRNDIEPFTQAIKHATWKINHEQFSGSEWISDEMKNILSDPRRLNLAINLIFTEKGEVFTITEISAGLYWNSNVVKKSVDEESIVSPGEVTNEVSKQAGHVGQAGEVGATSGQVMEENFRQVNAEAAEQSNSTSLLAETTTKKSTKEVDKTSATALTEYLEVVPQAIDVIHVDSSTFSRINDAKSDFSKGLQLIAHIVQQFTDTA